MKFLLSLLFAAVAGAGVAWVINEQTYSNRDAYFGPMGTDGDITAENVVEHISAKWPDGLAKAEVLGGTEHDFGVMSLNEKGAHTFTIRNSGNTDLSLRLGEATCKCTFGNLEDNVLPPGETTDVELQWVVKASGSEFGQSAEVLTNDPDNVAITFRIQGTVVRGIEFRPKRLTFGEVAAGETIELETTVYNYRDSDIEPTAVEFSSEALNERAEFQVTPIELSEQQDGIYAGARQGFRIKATIQPGLKQGSVSENLSLKYRLVDEQGDNDGDHRAYASVVGRIVGALRMVPSSKLKKTASGSYVYDFGRLDQDDSTEAETLVILKGMPQQDTKLSIGKTAPEGVVEATLDDGKSRGKMTLYRLHLDLIPGSEPIERLGSNKDDYGWVWIESSNPKIPPMKLLLTFALPAK